jgi:hypothetical protein
MFEKTIGVKPRSATDGQLWELVFMIERRYPLTLYIRTRGLSDPPNFAAALFHIGLDYWLERDTLILRRPVSRPILAMPCVYPWLIDGDALVRRGGGA